MITCKMCFFCLEKKPTKPLTEVLLRGKEWNPQRRRNLLSTCWLTCCLVCWCALMWQEKAAARRSRHNGGKRHHTELATLLFCQAHIADNKLSQSQSLRQKPCVTSKTKSSCKQVFNMSKKTKKNKWSLVFALYKCGIMFIFTSTTRKISSCCY